MTNDQISKSAKEYAEREYSGLLDEESCPFISGNDIIEAAESGFIDGAAFALSNQWISTKERLPEQHQLVIIHLRSTGPKHNLACYLNETWNTMYDYYLNNEVDLWMPIPKINPQKDKA